MLRAAATPERFLTSGFQRHLSAREGGAHRRAELRLEITMPKDLERFIAIAGAERIGAFLAKPRIGAFAAELAKDRGRLVALLAGAVPFGVVPRAKESWVYFLGDHAGVGRGVVARVDAETAAPHLVCRGASAFSLMCILHEYGEREITVPAPGVAEQESVRAAFERAALLADVLTGSDGALRRAARKLAPRALDVPRPPEATRDRSAPLALGALVEAFFRQEDTLGEQLALHAGSRDAIVASAAELLADAAASRPKSELARDLARRRVIALRAAKTTVGQPDDRAKLTRRLVAIVDEPLTPAELREEALLALADYGDRGAVPSLTARAVTGDAGAVDMLAALGDARAVPALLPLLNEPEHRALVPPVVRALGLLDAREAAPALRRLLLDNPLTSWRDGLARAPLVKEIIRALGKLRDRDSGEALLAILDSKSQEYRALLPVTAWAIGRIGHGPALPTLARMLESPKDPVSCEAIWAVGEIARHGEGERASVLLEETKGPLGVGQRLEPGAEIVRLTALVKSKREVKWPELRRALDRALWEPAFRQEETSRRRMWALRSLAELAPFVKRRKAESAFFLGHEAIRHFVTRDDHRVRRAAAAAFAAWSVAVPVTRRYDPVVLAELEIKGGLDALHEAVRDPFGVFRHNAATRIAERGDPSSVRPLAEATARLLAEPPTSTYEYDDAPYHLVAFVRALAKLNQPEGNDVLVDGIRAGNHQVRAVIAENTPDDQRFVPELMAMLGDPRSFLRSRAERSLAALGVQTKASEAPPRLVEL